MTPGVIHIGTSGWCYPYWKGAFYPRDLPNSQMLEHYCRYFNSVEINGSFYRLPNPSTLIRWREISPAGFCFSAKASRYLTHMKKLRDPQPTLSIFLERMQTLGDKLGPILLQLPPHWHFNAWRLEKLLTVLSADFRYAFEFRDHSWLNEQCFDLLARNNAALCLYELAGYRSPQRITADLVYLRLHGPAAAYQGSYDHTALQDLARSLRGWSNQGLDVYCYFDNDQQGYAACNALALQAMLQDGE
jgi:uncharacterized protein YecE (DUF72 family)